MDLVCQERHVGSPQILIIEDGSNIATSLSDHITHLAYKICGSADALPKAIALAKELQPDIVLMDCRLAIDGNSQDISPPLASLFSMPVILLITADDKTNLRRIARAATHGYLIVPFQLRELRAAVEVALYKAKLECRLRDSERWFADTLHCVTDGVIAVDDNGHICFLNLAAERILGVELELVQNQKIETVLHFEDAETLSAAEVLCSGATFGIDFGKWIFNAAAERLAVDHSAAPIRDENDHLIGAVVVIREASARIAAEDALRCSEERFDAFFAHASEGMALVTMDGRFVQGNPAICTLLKCSDIDIQKLKVSDIIPPEDRQMERQRLHRLIVGRVQSLLFERQIIVQGAEPLLMQITISLLFSDEAPFCLLYQFHDLTSQTLAESLERQQQSLNKRHELAVQEKKIAQAANRSKSAFIASMSHELRTPLNAILGFAQILDNGETSALTPDQRDSVKNIQRAGWHLLDLINDTLDLGKIESGILNFSIEDVDLQELLPECIQLIAAKAAESHITISADDNFDFIVKADRIRLRQVILNFLSNAVKYNRDGGNVTVTCLAQDDRVRIAVSDTGRGLSDEQTRHLFEPFNRLGKEGGKIEGSGIGLVITKSLVESMHGVIGVEGHPEIGCVFWVEFAKGSDREFYIGDVESSLPAVKQMAHASVSIRSRTVLCIEDNPVNMLLMSKILQRRPEWKLITAITGESGLALAINSIPDLILLDISLPDVSGLELIRRIRGNSITQEIPVVAVSANADSQSIAEALACGFDRYITKPIRLPEFIETIQGFFPEFKSE
jgi:PAS domain S-box-containing protein